jgi:hypothetical protein
MICSAICSWTPGAKLLWPFRIGIAIGKKALPLLLRQLGEIAVIKNDIAGETTGIGAQVGDLAAGEMNAV